MSFGARCLLGTACVVKTLWKQEIFRFVDKTGSKSNRRSFTLATRLPVMASETKIMKSEVLKIGTHNGCFHCDEALACFMLKQLDKYKDAEIVRSRDLSVLDKCDIVVDVGAVFDAKKNRFDHHQKSFQDTLSTLRPELGSKYNIRLSSAGLIFVHFGLDVIKAILSSSTLDMKADCLNVIYRKVYENLIEEIDAIDNGIPICDGTPKYKINTNLSARVGKLAPPWNSDKAADENELFAKAMAMVGEEFTSTVVYFATVWLPAREIVREALEKAQEVHDSLAIVELRKCCPWKEHLKDLEEELELSARTKYVLYQDQLDEWRVICVPTEPSSFICRKSLHKEWRGLRDMEIKKISGIEDAEFCHMNGFIGGAASREGVLAMAVKSLEGDYQD